MRKELVCWHCGRNLDDIPRPIRPSMRCPGCRMDLHTCRMCRHYNTRYIGDCAHDKADKVLDKQQANYCTYFTPRPDAHSPQENEAAEDAKAKLAALFGEGDAQTDESPEDENALTPGERARREAEALFDTEKLRKS